MSTSDVCMHVRRHLYTCAPPALPQMWIYYRHTCYRCAHTTDTHVIDVHIPQTRTLQFGCQMSPQAHVLELVVLFWDVVKSLGSTDSLKNVGNLETGLYRSSPPPHGSFFLSALLRCECTTTPIPWTGTHSHDYLPSPLLNWAGINPSLPKLLQRGISHQWENMNNTEDWPREVGLLQW